MKHLFRPPFRHYSVGVGILLLALLPLLLFLTSSRASAQCGTSMSSCKSCHEVQAKDPVGDKGEWHTAHAFGDFCEFCHAGSVEAKGQDEAHTGMVDPMVDVKASCQSCHPQDYNDKALVYASVLGIQLGSGGSGGAAAGGGAASGGGGGAASGGGGGAASGGGGGAASGGGGGAPAATGGGGSETAAAPAGEAAGAASAAGETATASTASAPSGELVDFNALYAESQVTEQLLTTGDIVLLVLIALLLLGFFVALWKFEHWGDRLLHWWQQNILPPETVAFQGAGAAVRLPAPAMRELAPPAPRPQVVAVPALAPIAVPLAAAADADLEELYRHKPELRQLTPYLLAADDATVQALTHLLQQPGASDAIVRLITLDLSLLAHLQALAPADQALLLALAQKR